jgi:hypothetical protein
MRTVQLRTILSQTLQNVETMPAFSADIFINRHYCSLSVDMDLLLFVFSDESPPGRSHELDIHVGTPSLGSTYLDMTNQTMRTKIICKKSTIFLNNLTLIIG